MKKTRFFAIIFLLLISWCSKQDEKIFLSFEETENIALENIHFLLDEHNSLFEFTNYTTQCDINSDDDSMKLDFDFSFSWFLDTKKNETLDMYPNIFFFDKKKHTEFSTSWLIQNLYHENQYYTKLSGFSIDMWKWNYESNLRYMIINNLSGKWIKYESIKFDNTRETQEDIKFLLNTLSSSSTFENIEQVSYEWDNAYKVAIKEDILNFIKEQTNIEITDFDWLFIIRSDDQVDLRVNNMQITYKNSLWTRKFTVNWIIWEDSWILNISKGEEKVEITFEMYKKYTKVNISKSINFNPMWVFDVNISKTQKDKSNKFNLKWNIQISPILIYWSDLENDLEINIKCLYENFILDGLNNTVQEPDSYILLDQILWDEFSIKNFIWDK